MAKLAQEAPPKRARGISPVLLRRLRPAAGIAVAASVAALAVFSVQQSGLMSTQMVASQADTETATGQTLANSGQAPGASMVAAQQVSDRYVVPAQSSNTSAFIPAARLTNYVVAHSEYSSPLGRRSVLSGVLAEGDAQSGDDLTEDVQDVTIPEEPAQR
jgi:hypothetical protein